MSRKSFIRSGIGGLCAVAIVAVSLGFASLIVRADSADLSTNNVNLTLTDAPIKSALGMLMKGTGISYTLDTSVHGTVTVDLQGVPFDAALRAVMRTCNPPLTYNVGEGGVLLFGPKSAAQTQPVLPPVPMVDPGNVQPINGSLRPQDVNQLIVVTDQNVILAGEKGQSPGDYEVIKLKYADAVTIANVFAPLPGQAPTIIVPPTTLLGNSPSVSQPTVSGASPVTNSGVVGRSGTLNPQNMNTAGQALGGNLVD